MFLIRILELRPSDLSIRLEAMCFLLFLVPSEGVEFGGKVVRNPSCDMAIVLVSLFLVQSMSEQVHRF